MLEYWYRALRSPHGIIIQVSDPEAVKQKLYQARRASLDEALNDISISVSPTASNELWLVKRNAKT